MTFVDTFLVVSVLLFLGSWLVVDIAIAVHYRPRWGTPTLTHEIQRLSQQYPAVPFFAGLVVGLLAGHFWGCF